MFHLISLTHGNCWNFSNDDDDETDANIRLYMIHVQNSVFGKANNTDISVAKSCVGTIVNEVIHTVVESGINSRTINSFVIKVSFMD